MLKKVLKNKLLSLELFIDNKFLDDYIDLIITKNEYRHKKGITQKHHIIPKCYFKHKNLPIDESLDNIVYLKYCNHVLAHKFLMYCTSGYLKYKMASSFSFLLFNCKRKQINKFKNELDIESLQKDYEKAEKIRLKLIKSKEYRERKAIITSEKLKGHIWIVNKEKKIQHHIKPEDINKFPNFIKGRLPYSEETKKKMSVSQRKGNALKAHKKTGDLIVSKFEERKRNGATIINERRAKKVICIEINKIFNSIKEAKLWIGRGDIASCVIHRQEKAANYHWAFIDDLEYIEIQKQRAKLYKTKRENFCNITKKTNYKKSGKRKKVKCIEKNIEFDSVFSAMRWLIKQNLSGDIYEALKYPFKTAGNYHWTEISMH